MLLIKKGFIYAPEIVGINDILISNKIEKVEKDLDIRGIPELNAENLVVIPGFIDIHNHINGAGGEGGPNFRTLPVKSEELLKNGITTVVGLLGTDGYTRSLIDLLYHARKLKIQGVTAYIYTGAYQVPGPTITGSVAKDIILIPEILGVKMALSDHRSSYPSKSDLMKTVTEARVGGIISGKPGTIHVHMGDGKDYFNPILNICEESDIPITQFVPTHIDRTEELLKEAVKFGRKKGNLDLTTDLNGEYPETLKNLKYLISQGVNIDNITFSTDGNGSLPIFDKDKNLLKVDVSPFDTLLKLFIFVMSHEKKLVTDYLKIVATNPGKRLNLKKGKINEGYDADLLIFDKSLNLLYVISNGNLRKL
jgi:beta-aspartyl-dipeptidase (metallo-type)